jgi:hypothetical protein
MKTNRLIAVAAVAALLGCGADLQNGNNNRKPGEQDPVEKQPEDPAKTCDPGRAYTGFDKSVPLNADRVEADYKVDRMRIKPYSALGDEYLRVIGRTPALYPSMAATFGSSPARWYDEPQASAVTLFASFKMAFQGCLDVTATAAEYGSAPEAAAAKSACQNWALGFWSRAPSTGEVDSCVRVATQDTSGEPDVRKRWAYTCAAVLNSAGFLAY